MVRHKSAESAAQPPAPAVNDAQASAHFLERIDQLQRQLDEVRHGLAHAHRLATLGTVSAIVAHEFNNILTPIISYCQLALSRDDDADLLRKSVEKSLDGAERAARICSAMLGFAQDEPAVAQMPVGEVAQVIDDALECMGRDPRKDGLKLDLQVESLNTAPPAATVPIGHVALQQVLVNLILNARRAMIGQRGGKLTISAVVNASRLELTVSDTGPGVPESVRERIFEPFVTERINPDPHAREPAGTGLGLSVCRDLVVQAGGEIQLDRSTPAGGATFHIVLSVQ